LVHRELKPKLKTRSKGGRRSRFGLASHVLFGGAEAEEGAKMIPHGGAVELVISQHFSFMRRMVSAQLGFFLKVFQRIVFVQQKIPSQFLSWDASDARKLDKQRVLLVR
jgi:hypothetical protein